MANIDEAKAKLDRFMRDEEGERLRPYLCQAGRPTIGVGATSYLDGRKVTLADPPISKEQMDRMLSVELDRYIGAVVGMTEGAVGTNQLIAFVMCAYNIGIEGLRGSSMMKAHKRGDYPAAARAFTLWNKYRPKPGAALVESPGLTARRLRESAIYLTPDDGAEPVPQAVQAESKLAASPIAQGGALTAGAGVFMSDLPAQIGPIKAALDSVRGVLVDSLGIPTQWLVPALLVSVGVAIVLNRWWQRNGGWA